MPLTRRRSWILMADGKGESACGTSMYPGLKKYFDDKDMNDYYAQDYDKAKELLKEAGYEDGFDMEITVCSADQPHVDAAQVIVEELKEIRGQCNDQTGRVADMAG